METQEKREKIKSLVCEMLNESQMAMMKKIDRALDSGAINIEGWDDKNGFMILPKCIVMALLESESAQYDGKGTSFERKVKKDVKNIRHFI